MEVIQPFIGKVSVKGFMIMMKRQPIVGEHSKLDNIVSSTATCGIKLLRQPMLSHSRVDTTSFTLIGLILKVFNE